MPSMSDAAKIRDVAARHAYVFDNGLSSPDFFDIQGRMMSEEFSLLTDRIPKGSSVLEVGCFTGLNLIGLQRTGHTGELHGAEFVEGARQWAANHAGPKLKLHGAFGSNKGEYRPSKEFERVICFDVLEHQLNVGSFLSLVERALIHNGQALFLVPIDAEFYDCGHVAFFPNMECLRNVLDYYFDVVEMFELRTCRKMFANCRRRSHASH